MSATRDKELPNLVRVTLLTTLGPVEAVPCLWDTCGERGVLRVLGTDELYTALAPGMPVADIPLAAVQARVCQDGGRCGADAWLVAAGTPQCDAYGAVLSACVAACR